MATTTRRFFGDAGSLRSFRGNNSSNPPSLKASSLKVRKLKVLAMSSLLGSNRGDQDVNVDLNAWDGIQDKDFNATGPDAPVATQKREDLPSASVADVRVDTENKAGNQNVPGSLTRPRSKSRTIIRLISTKFRSRSPPPDSLPRSPNQVPASNYAFKENRDAALRERGLLPPLKPNKDLSRAEREQDQYIPILAPPPIDGEILVVDGDSTRKVSAASLVKQQWEAKNEITATDLSQRERMNSFKFGRPSSPVSSPQEECLPPTGLEPVVEVDTPLPSPVTPNHSEYLSPVSKPESPKPSSLRSKRDLPPIALELNKSTRSAISQLSSTPSDPFHVPLPPSPLPSPRIYPRAPSDDDLTGDIIHISAASFPLPPSPSTSNVPGTPRSFKSPPPPVISLSPPANFAAAPDVSYGHPLSQLDITESGSSDLTPSLDASSHTMTISTLNTLDSSPNIGTRVTATALKIRVQDNNIPVIVESPVEETLIRGSILDASLVCEPSTIEVEDDDQQDTAAALRTRSRGLTDLSPNPSTPERRKSMNPFRRAHTTDSPNSPTTAPAAKSRSMATSINNIRRSVVGSLSRPKSTHNAGKTFNASHLPPSPTIPSSFAEQASRSPLSSPTQPRFLNPVAPAAVKLRQAVSPTLYSRGTILAETSHIEDEESRRMTELAFLG